MQLDTIYPSKTLTNTWLYIPSISVTY